MTGVRFTVSRINNLLTALVYKHLSEKNIEKIEQLNTKALTYALKWFTSCRSFQHGLEMHQSVLIYDLL